MPDQETQTKTYPLLNKGIVSKLDPALLQDGQLQASINTTSNVEGAITSRPGKLLVGTLAGIDQVHKITKLSIPVQILPVASASNTNPIVITTAVAHGWRTGFTVNIQNVLGNATANAQNWPITVTGPSTFSLDGKAGSGPYLNGGTVALTSGDPALRYIGEAGNIWRTNGDYATGSWTLVKTAVLNGLDPYAIGWAFASYSAGSTGNPIGYFATPGAMLKDQGNAPLTSLQTWGISAGLGAVNAVSAAGTFKAITGAVASGTLIAILCVGHGYATGQTIVITGVVGTTEANGTWIITVVDADHYTLNSSVFVNAYVSSGQAIVAGPDSTQPGALPYSYAYCVTPDTPILCDDLSWRPAGGLSAGQGIISFDENERLHEGKRCTRKYRKASIVSNTPEEKECFEVKTDIGIPVKATGDHPWLTWDDRRRIEGKAWGGFIWKQTSELMPGDKIAHFSKPWEEEDSKDAGWLAGIFDGEGWLVAQKCVSSGGCEWTAFAAGITQNEGPVLQRIRLALDARGISYYEYNGGPHGKAHQIRITKSRESMRFLGSVRPERLIEKIKKKDFLPGLMGKRTYDFATVSSIERLGVRQVASIQTSCGTFITAGYLSHNTYRDPATGDEGNPSPLMDGSLYVSSQNGPVTLTVWGSPDVKITGSQSIAIYRQGGSFADGIYRRIGYAVNPGVDGTGAPQSATFVDTTPDVALEFADQMEFDNFPPVVSTLRVPLNLTISSGSPGLSPGWNTLTLSGVVQNILLIGCSLTVGSISGGGNNNQETVAVAAVPYAAASSNTTVLVYLQLKHAAGEPVQIGSVAGQPCSLAVAAFDSMWVAGDPNNPQVLYNSKAGRPGSFPVVDSLGHSHSINVGTPSNGIQNICEFRGKILCLNVSNLFEVDYFQGILVGPNETPSERGLAARWAWCKSENAVYFLAYDGVWKWDGSRSTKISESIDTVFNFQPTPSAVPNGLPQLWRASIGQCRMTYFRNQLFLIYPYGPGGDNTILRYDILYDRWTQEIHEPFLGAVGQKFITTGYLEEDTSQLIFARTDPAGGGSGYFSQYNPEVQAYTDEYANGVAGNSFNVLIRPGFFRPADMARVQLFQDCLVDAYLQGINGTLNVQNFYDFSPTPSAFDTFTISTTDLRRHTYPLPLGLTGTPLTPLGVEAFAVSPVLSWVSTSIVTCFGFGVRFLDRDAVQAGMASDWMNLGSNNDKRIYQIHLEHITNNVLVKLHMDIRYGINGTQQANDVAIFQIQSTDKTTVTLPVPETNFPGNVTVCKSIRLRPEYYEPSSIPQISIGHTFRIFYKPTFDFETYPPDQALFTPWKDFGYACEKIAKVLNLDIDTGGVQASIQVQADGVNVGAPFLVTTTANDRRRNLPFASNPEPIGKQWRLTTLPGSNGKAQIFDWGIEVSKEPCQLSFIDTFEQAFGYDGFKFLKQIWLEYKCPVPITLTVLVDNGATLFSVQLPAHTSRDVERLYIPQSNAPIIGTVDTIGTAVAWDSGQQFTAPGWTGGSILIGASVYMVSAASDVTDLVLVSSAGTQSNAPYGILNVGTVLALNKSRVYRFQVTSTSLLLGNGFKIYMDASRFEWAGMSDQQRSAYQQMRFSELMTVPA